MKKFTTGMLCACLILSFAASGCSKHSSGNENLSGISVSEIQERIKEGKTTKKQVRDWLGDPSNIHKDKSGGYEVWTYEYTNQESQTRLTSFIPVVGGLIGGKDQKFESRRLGVTFRGNVVDSYTFNTIDN